MSNETIKLLAIDGGGTKTIAVLINHKGLKIGEGYAGASNYHVVGVDGAKKALTEAILTAFENAKIPLSNGVDIEKAVFAIAGIDTVQDQSEVEKMVNHVIQTLSINIHYYRVENDCLSSLLGATGKKPGVLLIAGTGSIAFAHDGNHHFVRSGGWGHILGDEGSGYWIGKKAIQSVLKMIDGRGEHTILATLLFEKSPFQTIDELYNWTYSDTFSTNQVGSLAAIVYEAFRLGDKVSKQILDDAVNELILLVTAAIYKENIKKEEFDLIIQGGIFQNNDYIKEQFCQKISELFPNVKINPNIEKPINNIIKRGLQLNE